MDDFTKVIRIGMVELGDYRRSTFCKIEYKEGRLSITGVEGPLSNGDCRGSCGQINSHPWEIAQYAPGWNEHMIDKFRGYWDAWHLNDMQAGSPRQTALLETPEAKAAYEAYKADKSQWDDARYPSHYDWACKFLAMNGLQPDNEHKHPITGQPYGYGSAWLKVAVPEDVLAWLKALPDTDLSPAWV